MLAARDQENLAHGHHTAAALKPLNQGTKQLAPKTPGNKAPKTPFKLPLNDENGPAGFGAGKGVLGVNAKGNDGLMTGGKKGGARDRNAFVTPMGPRNRAPLGLKTTNARAKAFQTPAAPGTDDALDKGTQNSGTAMKPKPRVAHAEMSKVAVLGGMDETEEREIEYMPPRATPLPDYPEDWPHDVDYSRFEGRGLTRGWYQHYCNPVGEDGLTLEARRWKQHEEKVDKYCDELIQKEIDEMPLLGINVPEFSGEDSIEEEIRKEKTERARKAKAAKESSELRKGPQKPLSTKAPAPLTSKNAAAALSQPEHASVAPRQPGSSTTTKSRMPTSIVNSKKKTPLPTNPSTMRHSAAVTASKTTLGYSKGRATSSTLKKSILPKTTATGAAAEIPDTTLAPAVYIRKYGIPPAGSQMWVRCMRSGCFDDDDDDLEDILRGTASASLFDEDDAEEDFHLVC
ncbi:hypothetical protein MMC16_005784 [Acarospora aff. strigata]|nr:hypothetical protein [Acarospora aff. strigata]